MADVEMRQVYCQTLTELAEKDPDLVILEADLMKSSGTLPFKEKYGKRAVECGVAEANMVGIASGLSLQGFIPFAATFGCFASRRAFDQFFISSNYARLNVKLVGTDPGVAAVFNGGTHMPFEDIGLMRMIPGLVISEPSDPVSLRETVKLMYRHNGCCYLRMHRQAVEQIYPEDETFSLGKSKILRNGSDVSLIALGAVMVHQTLQAAEMLDKCGIKADVIDALSIKPFDENLILSSIRKTGIAVTCENHQIDGGLGACVSKLIADNGISCKTGYIGIHDRFGQVGTLDYLLDNYGLSASHICNKVKELCKK